MGTILHTLTKRTVVLAAHSVVGRDPSHLVRLTNLAASNDHASITWTGDRWELRDLGSKYGTFVNNERVPLHERIVLSRNSILRFASDEEQWQLVDDCGPVVVARCLTTGESIFAENGVLEFPGAAEGDVTIFSDEDGCWFVEPPDAERYAAVSGEDILVGNRIWRLLVPPQQPYVGTYKANAPPALSTISLRFRVSLDRQHISVEILHQDEVIPLGERALFGVLEALARKRLAEETTMLPEAERGWYDLPDLVFDTKAANEQVVNTTICRLKKLFAKLGVQGGGKIIEKRLKKRRITISRLQIL